MGQLFFEVIEPARWKYVCGTCENDVSTSDAALWEGFMKHTIPAVLLKESVNVDTVGSVRVEKSPYGYCEIQDLSCRGCDTKMGWLYHGCSNPDEQYKRGCALVRQCALKKVSSEAPSIN